MESDVALFSTPDPTGVGTQMVAVNVHLNKLSKQYAKGVTPRGSGLDFLKHSKLQPPFIESVQETLQNPQKGSEWAKIAGFQATFR